METCANLTGSREGHKEQFVPSLLLHAVEDASCCETHRRLNARRGKCRVRLGGHLDEWCALKENLGFSLHSQLAKFLLDSYRSAVDPNKFTSNLEKAGLTAESLLPVSIAALQCLVLSSHQHGRDCPLPPSLSYPHVRGTKETLVLSWGCRAEHCFDWEPRAENTAQQKVPADLNSQDKLSESVKEHEFQLMVVTRQDEHLNNVAKPKSLSRYRQRSCSKLQRGGVNMLKMSVESSKLQPESPNREVEQIRVNSHEKETGNKRPSENTDQLEIKTSTDEERQSNVREDSPQQSPRVDKSWQENTFCREPGSQHKPEETGGSDNKYLADISLREDTAGVKAAQNLSINATKNISDIRKGKRHTQLMETFQKMAEYAKATTPVPFINPISVSKITSDDPGGKSEQGQAEEFQRCEQISEEFNTAGEAQGCDGSNPERVPNIQVSPKVQIMQTDGNQETPKTDLVLVSESEKTKTVSEDTRTTARSCTDEEQTCKKRTRKSTTHELLLCEFADCGRIFSKRQYLNYHQKYQHMNQRTFCCSAPGCGRSFNFKKHLKEHEKRHSGRRDFICEFCAHAFLSNSNLIVHRRIHTGEKPLQCEFCGFTCRQKASLNWHMKKHDADIFYQFPCDVCGQRFEKRDNLAAHRSRKHPAIREDTAAESVQCEICATEHPHGKAPCYQTAFQDPISKEREVTAENTSQDNMKITVLPEFSKRPENIAQAPEVNPNNVSLVIIL